MPMDVKHVNVNYVEVYHVYLFHRNVDVIMVRIWMPMVVKRVHAYQIQKKHHGKPIFKNKKKEIISFSFQ